VVPEALVAERGEQAVAAAKALPKPKARATPKGKVMSRAKERWRASVKENLEE
jgi:hypothetical protein